MLNSVRTLLYDRFYVKIFLCIFVITFLFPSFFAMNYACASPKKTVATAPSKATSAKKKNVKNKQNNLLIRMVKMKDFDRIVFDWESYTKFDLNNENDTIQIFFNKKASINTNNIQKKLPKRIKRFEQIETDSGIGFLLSLTKNSGVRPFRFDNQIMLDIFNKNKPIGKVKDSIKHSSIKKTNNGTTIVSPTPKKMPIKNLIKKTDTITIPSKVGSALSVFRKDNYIWIVSDQPLAFDKIKTKSLKTKEAIQRLASPSGTTIRIPVSNKINPTVIRDSKGWIIELKKQKIRPNLFIPIKALNENTLSLKIINTVSSIKINDPDTGDMLEVIPITTPDYGVDGTRDFVVFKLFESVQGIAIQHKMKGLTVKRNARKILLTRKKGLFLALSLFEEEKYENQNLFDLEEWQKLGSLNNGNKNFMRQKQFLQNKIRQAKKASLKNKYRFKLAKLTFSYGAWDQSLAIFKVLTKKTPRFVHKPQLRAIMGASYYLAGKNKKALKVLEELRNAKREYKQNIDLALWLGAIHFKEKNYKKAYELFQSAKEVPAYYPDGYRTKLAMSIAENFLYTRNPKAGVVFVDKFIEDIPRSAEKFTLIKSKLTRAYNDHKGAIEILKPLLLSKDLWVRSNSWFLYTKWRLSRREINVEKAINELERQRLLWQGDQHEFSLLYELAHMHLKKKNYRKAMTYFRTIVHKFPTNKKVKEIVKTLTETFFQLFYDGKADSMPALKSLALFNDFRELIPADKKGDEIVKKMIDKLLSLDLLNRAAILLEHQVKYRLKGKDLAENGAKLAGIYLDNNRPQYAEMAIVKSNYKKISKELLNKRKKLLARSFMEQERFSSALKALNTAYDKESKILKVEIYWRSQNWSEAARSIKSIIQKSDSPYDSETREFIVNCAVALTLAGDEIKIDLLQKKYGLGMKKGYLSADFSAITDKNINAASFADFVLRFKSVEKFQSFLESYRKRL